MRSLLSKIAIRKAIGLCLGDHEVTVAKVASTPLGPVVIASSSEPCTPDTVPEAIERLLVPLVGRTRRPPVAVGLAASRLFFGTRLTPTNGEVRPETELQKALCSSNLALDDLVVDLLRGTVNKLPVAHMVACRTKYMTAVVETLSRLGVRPVRAEPRLRLAPPGGTKLSGSPPVQGGVASVSGRVPRAGRGGCRRLAVGLEILRLARHVGRFCHSLGGPGVGHPATPFWD